MFAPPVMPHPGRLYGTSLNRHTAREPPPGLSNVTKVSCGDLREYHVGMEVELCGRVQYQRVGRFLTLRDQHGMTQVVAPDDRPDIGRRLANMPIESFVAVRGWVCSRPPGQRNMVKVIEQLVQGALLHLLNIESPSVTSRFARRTHTCGDLTEDLIGDEVYLCGWVELKRLGRFITLRDGYGAAQLVASSTRPDICRLISNVRLDSIITVKGLVCARPPGQKNMRMPTGSIEVFITELEVVDSNSKIEPKLPKGNTDISVQIRKFSTSVNAGADVPKIVPETNKFTQRTHTCGELRECHVGQEVTLYGWVEFQRMGKFVTLRDGYGTTQLVAPEDRRDIALQLENIPFESVVAATGIVCSRPPRQENSNMPTGNIEMVLKEFKIVNPAKKQLPFLIRDFNKAKEQLRLKYRYLDLRFPEMQHNLRIRSKVLMKMREYLCCHCDFVDVETPTLFRRTPGGAQEFVVPTKLPGQFYSLVQSPQQFKQLLMIGGLDRYFQIAHCYRDEGAKPDRQPEFTQLDIELSFVDREGIISLIEGLLEHSWPEDSNNKVIGPFPRMTYKEAMEQYGTDKPDTRFEMKIHFTTAVKNKYEDLTKKHFSSTKLILSKVQSVSEWEKNINKTFAEQTVTALKEKVNPDSFDLIMLALGPKEQVSKGVNHHRSPGFNFLWVLDFPMFVKNEESGEIESAHHPFTQPHPDDLEILQKDPLQARSLHYDLVLNGCEVGGGSIRIHDPQLQLHVIKDILHIDPSSLQHLLDALHSGCPPHGGIDRLIATLCGCESIRDVIAFPKTMEGRDLMSGAPVPITQEEKQRYYIQTLDEVLMEQDVDYKNEVKTVTFNH
ncbi:hypothetical protein C0J52_06622 [Blattella germanica]|nr:hypothetical protein C0J52_06622 [Blattella germanica]